MSASVDGLAQARRALSAFQHQLPRTVQLRCQLRPHGLHIDRIHVVASARGQGSVVLRELLALMDAAELPVTLHAQATGKPQDPSQEDLVRWYQRFGFDVIAHEDEGPFLQRSVGAPEQQAEPDGPAPTRRRPRL